MTDSERLQRIDTRQEAVIQAINGLTGVMENQQAVLLEMQAWMQEPPSSDLPDLLERLTKIIGDLQDAIVLQGREIVRLADRIETAMRPSE